METLQNIFQAEIFQILGWTLVHFVWEGLAIGLVLAVVLTLLRKSSANLRYLTACIALVVIVLMPLITMRMVDVPAAAADPVKLEALFPEVSAETEAVIDIPNVETPPIPMPVAAMDKVPLKDRFIGYIEAALPYVVVGWLLGVFCLSFWYLGGWRQLQRLRRRMVKEVAPSFKAKLQELSQALGIEKTVRLMESALVGVPAVVGHLKPVILLPASALTGLSFDEIEALLAHELAHVKRCDYLVNLLQTVVEILGFYHPAVWWISHEIRVERENCCDDIAVSLCSDKLSYAKALATMEEIRGGGRLAVAASGGSLFGRIRRLAGKDNANEGKLSWLPSVIVMLVIASLLVPTGIALTGDPGEQVDGKEEWGLAVEGVQIRVEPTQQAWDEGDTPKFVMDIRNKGAVEWDLVLAQESWEVEIDGVWFRTGTMYTGIVPTLLLDPGDEHKDIEFSPEKSLSWNRNGKAMDLVPGWHTVRLAFGPATRDRAYWRRLRVVSNPVMIEIVPTGDKEDVTETVTPASTTLAGELHQLWEQRGKGLSAADDFGKELLKKYTKYEEKALIYFQLAEIYAQSGQSNPNKIVEYARQSWWNLHDPVKNARLFVYWGDALQLSKDRREAGSIYLRGLEFCLQFGLPKDKPQLPGKETNRQMAARQHASLIAELIEYRQMLTGKILQLYSKPPDAFDELHEIAMKSLGSEQAAQELIAAAKSSRTDRKTAIPVFLRTGRDPDPKENLGWGQESKGIRVRLRADTGPWAAGSAPTFKVDVRNDGSEGYLLTASPECWGIEIDGIWYKTRISLLGGAKGMSFGPDKRWYNLELSLDMALAELSNIGVVLGPGTHTIRASLAAGESENRQTVPIGAVSDPVEVEILPKENNNDVKELEDKGVTLREHGRVDEVIDYFKKAIEASDSADTAMLQLGEIYTDKGDYEKALNYFDMLLKFHPNDKTISAKVSSLKKDLENAEQVPWGTPNTGLQIRLVLPKKQGEPLPVITPDSLVANLEVRNVSDKPIKLAGQNTTGGRKTVANDWLIGLTVGVSQASHGARTFFRADDQDDYWSRIGNMPSSITIEPGKKTVFKIQLRRLVDYNGTNLLSLRGRCDIQPVLHANNDNFGLWNGTAVGKYVSVMIK